MSFLSYLINGISLGSVYAIIALGYTMVHGIAKMLNFAHGDVIMIGSFVVFITTSATGMNPLLAVLLSVVICTILGIVIERLAYKPLRGASPGRTDYCDWCQLLFTKHCAPFIWCKSEILHICGEGSGAESGGR